LRGGRTSGQQNDDKDGGTPPHSSYGYHDYCRGYDTPLGDVYFSWCKDIR
jgi:hypothetical protein